MAAMRDFTAQPMALVASSTQAAQAAERMLRKRYDLVPLSAAQLIVALGGDGFPLQTHNAVLHLEKLCPVFGMHHGTAGFLMTDCRPTRLEDPIPRETEL